MSGGVEVAARTSIYRRASLGRWTLVLTVGWGCLLTPAPSVRAQWFRDAAAAADSDGEDDSPYTPGLIVEVVDPQGRRRTTLKDSLAVVADELPFDRRTGGQRPQARFGGRLWVQSPGAYRLHAFATGKVRLALAGETILDGETDKPDWIRGTEVELSFGFHPLEFEYESGEPSAKLAVYWEGPNFQFEPIASRWLFHDRDQTPSADFDRGDQLVRALRCGSCHRVPGESLPLPGPALDHLAGNISRTWLVDWLTAQPNERRAARRMPHYDFTPEQAAAVADSLLQASEALPREPHEKPAPGAAKAARKNVEQPPPPSAELGARIFRSIGCLACHQVDELGANTPFGGGDLTRIAEKRPADFFANWLAAPERFNRNHRMPTFSLSSDQRTSLSLYLATLGDAGPSIDTVSSNNSSLGAELIREARCASCHVMPSSLQSAAVAHIEISPEALDLEGYACLSEPDASTSRPGYRLHDNDQRSIQVYLSGAAKQQPAATAAGHRLMRDNNCLACHARGYDKGLAERLPAVAEADASLAELLPALTPPALHGIGDKLHDESLRDSLSNPSQPRRPWLNVRMPKFPLVPKEVTAITQYLVARDRIQPRPEAELTEFDASLPTEALDAAGPRLVTADGFGCTSCHAIGKWEPQKVALNAHGTALSEVGKRVRREWFDRWVRNPARIVPQMEMPSVQQPVRGVLDANLDEQLAAVWRVLNRPDFTPPNPSALRVVRRSNLPDVNEPAAVLTDVIEVAAKGFIKPLVIGLDNRHNVLFDLETGQLAAWWIGDTGRQTTRGKSWFWEAGMPQLLPVDSKEQLPSDLWLAIPLGSSPAIRDAGEARSGQFITEFDSFKHTPRGVEFVYRLHFQIGVPILVQVRELYESLPLDALGRSGFRRSIALKTVGDQRSKISWHQKLFPRDAIIADDGRSATYAGPHGEVEVALPHDAPAEWKLGRGFGVELSGTLPANIVVEYRSQASPDQFPPLPVIDRTLPRQELNVVPGYNAVQLPITDEVMPTAIAWGRDGAMFVSSLEGRVWRGRDTDGDQLVDTLEPFSDDLAAPYGIQVVKDAPRGTAVDVINKYALLRLYDEDGDGRAERTETLASGWGHTRDYHDWAVGLPRDAAGNHYIALPCEQDGRSETAAYLRGRAVKLIPREPTSGDPRRFSLEEICAGLRFPQGLILTDDDQLFATDNQGHYNPFNELNHLEPGQRYGFINSLEAKRGLKPPFRTAAIEIPHPWTRSVNGLGHAPPPFSGDLIGCEYDTRRLVRMSLERVAGEYQGAVYPFSREVVGDESTFEGPLCCATAPNGDLYIGNIRDSGWGAGSNTGSIVRLQYTGEVPCGIQAVTLQPNGFQIEFTRSVDSVAAANTANYSVASYRRVSTPAYGGEDLDRRVEKVQSVQVLNNGRTVHLTLDELREGFVYEFHLRNLSGGSEFFPAEAYYTLRHRLPEKK